MVIFKCLSLTALSTLQKKKKHKTNMKGEEEQGHKKKTTTYVSLRLSNTSILGHICCTHTHSLSHPLINIHTHTHTHHTHTLTLSKSGRYELIRFLEVKEIGF